MTIDAGLIVALVGFALIAFMVVLVYLGVTDDQRSGAQRCADGEHEWPMWIGAGMVSGTVPCLRGCGARRCGRDWARDDRAGEL